MSSLRCALLGSAASAVILAAFAAPAFAADGDGGRGAGGAPGGTASDLATGNNGSNGAAAKDGGGGGGAGVSGGNGGTGFGTSSTGGAGGAGASTAGGQGGAGGAGGNSEAGAGGGGGGAHGYVGSVAGAPAGGATGGTGGADGSTDGFFSGGGGGGGGFGAVLSGFSSSTAPITGSFSGGGGGIAYGINGGGGNGGSGLVIWHPGPGDVVTLAAPSTIEGGAGGFGSGAGGNGGTGLVILGGSGGNTFNLAGTISGGAAGPGAAGIENGTGANGGAGIAVSGATGPTTLTISGDVTGGAGSQGALGNGIGAAAITGANLSVVLVGRASATGGANGGTGQAPAIAFTGGTNTLELQATDLGQPTVNGGISHAGSGDTLVLGGSSNGSVAANMANGFGSFVKSGSSTWTLTGLPASGPSSWSLNAGTLAITSDVFGGSSPIVFGGGTLQPTGTMVLSEPLQFSGSGTISPAAGTTFIAANTLSGTGAFTKAGAGNLVLEADSSAYSGPVTIASGTLALSGIASLSGASSWTLAGGNLDISALDGGTTISNLSGAAAGSTVSLGGNALSIDEAANTSFAGTFTGTGGLTKTGAGTLLLTGNSTATGPTTIAQGTLQLGNGGTSGTLGGPIVNDATLLIDRSDSVTLQNAISGAGTVVIGGGTVSFANSVGGSIAALGGDLDLVGTNTGTAAVVIGNGSTLEGNGSVGSLTVLSGGRVAPGNSPGTVTVNGSVALTSGSVYDVDATPTGTADRIAASGAVSIANGTSVAVTAGAGHYTPQTSYTILTSAEAVTGTFGSVTSNYAFLVPSLSYDARDVTLTLDYNGKDFANFAQTANHAAVASAAQDLGVGNAVFDSLMMLPESSVDSAFDQLSGEAYASLGTIIQQQSIYVRQAVGDRLRQSLSAPGFESTAPGTGPAAAPLGKDHGAAVWADGFGGWGDSGSDGNAGSITNSIGGFLLGADMAVMPNVRAGVFGGLSRSWFDAGDTGASGSIDGYDIGVYAGAQLGAIALRGGAAYAWNTVSLSRAVNLAGLSETDEGNYTTGTTQVFGEVGYDLSARAARFEPFAGLSYVNVGGASFAESGGATALGVATEGMETLYSTLGLRMATTIDAGGHNLTPRATLGWQHAFGDTVPTASMTFAGASAPFSVNGVPIAPDALLVEAGLGYQLSGNAELGAAYSGQFAGTSTQNALNVNLSVKF